MANTIVNSADKNRYFTNAGVAIVATNQPNINDTVMAGTLDSALGADMYGFVPSSPIANVTSTTGYNNTQVIMGISNTIRGVANTALQSPGAEPPESISTSQLTALRVNPVGSGLRAGTWNVFSGDFVPSILNINRNDFAAVGNDNESDSDKDSPGFYTFLSNGGSPTTTGYPSRSQ